jgi:hypothetical protein
MIAPKLGTLGAKSSEELEALYDQNTDNVQLGLDFLRREIEWRKQAEFSERTEKMTRNMESMTGQITNLTVTIRRLTWVAVFISCASLAVSVWPIAKGFFQ